MRTYRLSRLKLVAAELTHMQSQAGAWDREKPSQHEQNTMDNKEFLITLNVPPSLEEAVVDCLLTFEAEHGFSSIAINAHDHKNEGLSLAEQVTGRQRKIRFQMYIAQQDLNQLLDRLKTDFSGAGIHYWVLPVIEKGVI